MKAIQVTEPGGPEKLELVEVPKPTPGPKQALVRIFATGVNFIDVYFRIGLLGVPAFLITNSTRPCGTLLRESTKEKSFAVTLTSGSAVPAELDALAVAPAWMPTVDALDACAAAWSAQRIAEGRAESVGDDRRDARGRPMRISY